MSLTARQERYLAKITQLVRAIEGEAKAAVSNPSNHGRRVRRRRSKEDAAKMRTEVLAARARGESVARLAKKYGVSSAYIYMIKE